MNRRWKFIAKDCWGSLHQPMLVLSVVLDGEEIAEVKGFDRDSLASQIRLELSARAVAFEDEDLKFEIEKAADAALGLY